jgi:hypothetical protein
VPDPAATVRRLAESLGLSADADTHYDWAEIGTVCWGETADGWACGWAPVSADPGEWEVVAVKPARGHMMGDGLSFTTALRQYAARDPLAMIRPRVVPKRAAAFTPYRADVGGGGGGE